MKRHLVTYKAKPERAEENQQLIEAVFRELHAKLPDDLRYAALRLADDTFVHIVASNEEPSPLVTLEAFRRFQEGIQERCSEAPRRQQVTVVGNYRMLDEADIESLPKAVRRA
jgi:hypothetical protein